MFSRGVRTETGAEPGQIEIAFSLVRDDETDQWSVEPISESPLVVFFPTVLTTHLGFLVQGPYRTTPSRDNVPRNDSWNRQLVSETATLLLEALQALRDMGLLNVAALRSLPLDRSRFEEGQMFAPLFEAVRSALATPGQSSTDRRRRAQPGGDPGEAAAAA